MKIDKYFRRFTVLLPNRIPPIKNLAPYFSELCIIWAVILLSVLVLISYYLYQDWQAVQTTRNKEIQQLAYWNQVIHDQPNYPKAYYQAAIYAAQLHDFPKAFSYLQKSLFLDPNFTQAEVFAQEIQKKQ